MTEQHVRLALRDCYHPEIPLNILALGLVEGIELAPDPDAPGAGIPGVPERFKLCLTLLPATEDESARAQLTAIVRNRLAGLESLAKVEVMLADAPAWTPARISPEGRRALRLDQPQFPILNNRIR